MVRRAGARVPENFVWNGLAPGFKMSSLRGVSCCATWKLETDDLVAGAKESVVRGGWAHGSGISEWVPISGALRKLSLPVDVLGILRVNRGRGFSWTSLAAICQFQTRILFADFLDTYLD